MKSFALYCLPHAGGSSYLFNPWINVLDQEIECIPIEYPNRGKSILKSPYFDIQEAAIDALEQIKLTLQGRDYALFGHSMGALITYELLHKINETNMNRPTHVYFSGRAAPFHNRDAKSLKHNLSDELFLQEIIKLGGLPTEFIQNQELIDYFLPIIKDDFRLVETYNYLLREPIQQNVSVLYGSKDDSIIGSIEDWNEVFSSTISYHKFDGGHFFYQHHISTIAGIINQMFKNIAQ